MNLLLAITIIVDASGHGNFTSIQAAINSLAVDSSAPRYIMIKKGVYNEKIFIENRIYRRIEECETWEAVMEAIWKGLKPHLGQLKREVTDDDVARLTEIKIKRISKYNSFEADEHIRGLEKDIDQVQKNLKQMTRFTVAHFERLKKTYAAGREQSLEDAIRRFVNRGPELQRAAAVRASRPRTMDEHFADLFARYQALAPTRVSQPAVAVGGALPVLEPLTEVALARASARTK